MANFAFVDLSGRQYQAATRYHRDDDLLSYSTSKFIASLPTPPQYRDIFYAGEGAVIERFDNRLFVGGATYNDGAKPNVLTDWLTDLVNWPVYNATAAITSPIGRIALTVGSETRYLDPVDAGTTQTTIGLAAFAMANNPGVYPGDYFAAYGLYSEGRVYPGVVSTAFAAELEAINLHPAVVDVPTPYHDLYLSGTQGLRIGSGGGQGLTVYDALAGAVFVGNGAKFKSGLIFASNSITGTDGVTGFGPALQLAKGHTLEWYYNDGANGALASFITSTATQQVVSLQFQNAGTLFITPAGKIAYALDNVASSVNYLAISPAVAGQAVDVKTQGDEANVDLAFKPKGTGALRSYTPLFSFYSSGGSPLSAIQNQVTIGAKFKVLNIQDTGFEFYSNAGGVLYKVTNVDNAVNYLSVSPAIAGASPRHEVFGGSANIDQEFYFKGTGTLSLYVPTTNSATAGGATALPANPTTYLTVKVGGTTMKIPAYNT